MTCNVLAAVSSAWLDEIVVRDDCHIKQGVAPLSSVSDT